MSIQSTVGNIKHNIGDNVSTVVSQGKSRLESIINSTTTSFRNVWSGGFAGMSDTGIQELKNQLNKFCKEIDDLISSFDQEGDITQALKGDPQTAAYEFIDAVKKLLVAYVSQMRKEISEMDDAYASFVESGKSIASDVNAAAQDIRANAEAIKID